MSVGVVALGLLALAAVVYWIVLAAGMDELRKALERLADCANARLCALNPAEVAASASALASEIAKSRAILSSHLPEPAEDRWTAVMEKRARALAKAYWRGRGEEITKEQEDEFWWSFARDAQMLSKDEPAEGTGLREAAQRMLAYYDNDHGSRNSEESGVRNAVRRALR